MAAYFFRRGAVVGPTHKCADAHAQSITFLTYKQVTKMKQWRTFYPLPRTSSLVFNILWLTFALSFLWFPYLGMVIFPCRNQRGSLHSKGDAVSQHSWSPYSHLDNDPTLNISTDGKFSTILLFSCVTIVLVCMQSQSLCQIQVFLRSHRLV